MVSEGKLSRADLSKNRFYFRISKPFDLSLNMVVD